LSTSSQATQCPIYTGGVSSLTLVSDKRDVKKYALSYHLLTANKLLYTLLTLMRDTSNFYGQLEFVMRFQSLLLFVQHQRLCAFALT